MLRSLVGSEMCIRDRQGIEPQAMGSDEFNRLLRSDFERMSKVVKASGARVD